MKEPSIAAIFSDGRKLDIMLDGKIVV